MDGIRSRALGRPDRLLGRARRFRIGEQPPTAGLDPRSHRGVGAYDPLRHRAGPLEFVHVGLQAGVQMAGRSSSGAASAGLPASAPLPARLGLAVAACSTVFPLLAWVSGVASFRTVALVVALPVLLALLGVTAWMDRTGRWPDTRAAILAGALGGALGTLAYDLVRVPFVYLLGLQLLAPIDSYGVLLTGASTSSGLTGFAGWMYHFANGIGFGVAYAVMASRRSWRWGIAWGLLLESVAVFSPFAARYGLVTDGTIAWLPIALAYGAHIPYGAIVGVFGQRSPEVAVQARAWFPAPVLGVIGVIAVVIALFTRPLVPDADWDRGTAVADGPSAIILEGMFVPAWLRVPVGGCATLENGDATTVTLSTGASIEAGATATICGARPGTTRVRVNDVPFAGGWLLVDPTLP